MRRQAPRAILCLQRINPHPWPLRRQDRLVEEAGAEAILCLQSGLCHEALQIDWPAIREHALERGVVITRVAVRDFDHNDQVSGLSPASKPWRKVLCCDHNDQVLRCDYTRSRSDAASYCGRCAPQRYCCGVVQVDSVHTMLSLWRLA